MDIPSEIKHLVFSGGGMRGLAYAGVLDALRGRGVDLWSHARPLQSVCGSSIGALFAMLVAARMSVEHMLLEVRRFHVTQYLDLDPYLLFNQRGIDNGLTLRRYVQGLLLRLMGNAHISMHEFYLATRVRLVVPITDLEEGKTIYLDHARAPALPVAEALAISMSLPLVFTPSIFEGHQCVDGGLMDNFPLSLFPPATTLGVRALWNSSGSLDSFSQYLSRVVYCVFASCENKDVGTYATIDVDVGNVKTVEFHLDEEQIEHLLQCGHQAVRAAAAAARAKEGGGASPACTDPPDGPLQPHTPAVRTSVRAMLQHVCYQVALRARALPAAAPVPAGAAAPHAHAHAHAHAHHAPAPAHFSHPLGVQADQVGQQHHHQE